MVLLELDRSVDSYVAALSNAIEQFDSRSCLEIGDKLYECGRTAYDNALRIAEIRRSPKACYAAAEKFKSIGEEERAMEAFSITMKIAKSRNDLVTLIKAEKQYQRLSQ